MYRDDYGLLLCPRFFGRRNGSYRFGNGTNRKCGRLILPYIILPFGNRVNRTPY